MYYISEKNAIEMLRMDGTHLVICDAYKCAYIVRNGRHIGLHPKNFDQVRYGVAMRMVREGIVKRWCDPDMELARQKFAYVLKSNGRTQFFNAEGDDYYELL